MHMAMSGYQEAVNYVLSDKDPAVDFIDNEGNFWTDTDAKTQPVTGMTNNRGRRGGDKDH